MRIVKLLEALRWNLSGNQGRIKILRKQGVRLGSGCEIYRDVNFGSEPYLITLGDRVRITSGCKLITHDGGIWTLKKAGYIEEGGIYGAIRIGENTHIGMAAVIMPGVEIGKNCIIGCGAVVTRSIPDDSVAVGVPARVIETVSDYYRKHKDDIDYTAYCGPDEKQAKLEAGFRS